MSTNWTTTWIERVPVGTRPVAVCGMKPVRLWRTVLVTPESWAWVPSVWPVLPRKVAVTIALAGIARVAAEPAREREGDLAGIDRGRGRGHVDGLAERRIAERTVRDEALAGRAGHRLEEAADGVADQRRAALDHGPAWHRRHRLPIGGAGAGFAVTVDDQIAARRGAGGSRDGERRGQHGGRRNGARQLPGKAQEPRQAGAALGRAACAAAGPAEAEQPGADQADRRRLRHQDLGRGGAEGDVIEHHETRHSLNSTDLAMPAKPVPSPTPGQ